MSRAISPSSSLMGAGWWSCCVASSSPSSRRSAFQHLRRMRDSSRPLARAAEARCGNELRSAVPNAGKRFGAARAIRNATARGRRSMPHERSRSVVGVDDGRVVANHARRNRATNGHQALARAKGASAKAAGSATTPQSLDLDPWHAQCDAEGGMRFWLTYHGSQIGTN